MSIGLKDNTRKRMTKVFILLILVIACLAILVPVLSPYSYEDQNAAWKNLGPSLSHPFGTDKFGRDIFVRVFYGARISLTIGLASTAINLAIGILWGGLSGYAGGLTDLIMMRIAEIISAIPSLLYIILLMLFLGAGEASMILGICIAGWTGTARLVRGETIRLKYEQFCLAAKIGGAGDFRLFFRHMLPNMAGTLMVQAMVLLPQAIYTESFLSFVGVGIMAPKASLGVLIQDARSQMQLYPGQILYPIAVLCGILLALNFAGRSIGRASDRKEDTKG